MKHENATSADNAQIAATIRHTLTFEEVYAMTYVRESIECLLDQNLRQYPVLNGYKDDLRQEILIRLNNELPVFDPEKSSFNTFFRRVLHAAMYDARKVYFRNQNLTLRFAAELYSPESGRTLQIYTTQPGIQIYTGNWLSGSPEGKCGRSYGDYEGVAMECQKYPDSPNEPDYPSTVLRPGETYKEAIIFSFGIRN